MRGNRLKLIGQRFNKLIVLEDAGNDKRGSSQWLCKCDCGTEKFIARGANLKNNDVQSCGCYQKERATKLNYKHGGSGTRLYNIWRGMRDRCNNPNNQRYKNYSGRGILITEEWSDYSVFRDWALKNNYQDCLSIDRKNVNGNYEPGNCRWVDNKTQNENKQVYCALVDYSTEELIQELKRRNLGKIFSSPNNNI